MKKSALNRSSEFRLSKIVRLFAERAASSPSHDPKSVLKKLLAAMQKQVGWTKRMPRLEAALAARGVREVRYTPGDNCDGRLEPLGTSFGEGFRLHLSTKGSRARVRFTQAHEICHTFFYQFAPELKFRPHPEDVQEEQLCNFGAAELLMPERSLRDEARPLCPCIDSLTDLSGRYGVSVDAMILRLRHLGIWSSELLVWRREPGGEFTLDRIVGGPHRSWSWDDQTIPARAWDAGRYSGHTYLRFRASADSEHFKSISFDAKREGSSLLVLSGCKGARRGLPLLDSVRVSETARAR